MSDQPDNETKPEEPKPEEDPNKDTLVGQFKSLSKVFWLAGWMELIERFAYFGVRNIIPLFMVAAFVEGGPQLDHIQKANIYGVWAVVQCFVPILSGGFADRYGCKINIAMATVFKILGYLVMAYTVQLSEWLAGMPLADARAQGIDHAYGIFFAGAMLLAFGTAIFKPGIGGLIATQLKGKVSAMGWALFYQLVNVGGFVGPLVAGYLRVWDWNYVFLICSAVICLNFIPLFFFKEPLKVADEDKDKQPGPLVMLYNSIKGLLEPRLFFFTIAFAGFWLMYNQLFDILPNFIDDWIDSRAMANALVGVLDPVINVVRPVCLFLLSLVGGIFNVEGAKEAVSAWSGQGVVPTVHEGNLTQEWIINFNPMLISVGAFAVGYVTGKIRSLTTIILGIVFCTISIYGLGFTMTGWWVLGCIVIFSVGEMLAGPTTNRYLMQIAPEGKKGLYIGYSGFTGGIGWAIGSIIAGHLYETGGDKVVLARKYLSEHGGVNADVVDALPKSEVLPFFEKTLGVDSWGLRDLLWQTYSPYSMWTVFALIGLGSMVALIVYNHYVKKADEREDHSFNVHGDRWVLVFLVPLVLVCGYYTWEGISKYLKTEPGEGSPPIALTMIFLFFLMMLVISIIQMARGGKIDAKPIKVH